MTTMTDIQVAESPLTTAFGLIDRALADMAGVNVVEASKMTDLLLDIRLLFMETSASDSAEAES